MPSSLSTRKIAHNYFYWDVDWKDPEFRKIALEMLSPKHPLNLTAPPTGQIGIAMHVREGGGADSDDLMYIHPLKRPPFRYYADIPRAVLKMFKHPPIYCYIFTDAPDPQKVAEEIQSMLPADLPIFFTYRHENNHHSKMVGSLRNRF